MRSDALSIALGDVRDGVAAIEHFLEVLASRRVGPRMVTRAIPEMAAGCAPLLAALAALIEALTSALVDDPAGLDAVRGLVANASAKVLELGAALEAHVGATVDARVRLSLEAVVRRVAGELSATLRLVDMLGAPVTSDTVTIDLGDALHARRAIGRSTAPPHDGARAQGPATARVPIELRTDEVAVGDARLLLNVLEHAITWVIRAGEKAPRVVVEAGPEGFPMFTVRGGARAADLTAPLAFDATLRDELPHERGVVRAAAHHAGISLTIADDGRTVTIAL